MICKSFLWCNECLCDTKQKQQIIQNNHLPIFHMKIASMTEKKIFVRFNNKFNTNINAVYHQYLNAT